MTKSYQIGIAEFVAKRVSALSGEDKGLIVESADVLLHAPRADAVLMDMLSKTMTKIDEQLNNSKARALLSLARKHDCVTGCVESCRRRLSAPRSRRIFRSTAGMSCSSRRRWSGATTTRVSLMSPRTSAPS